MPPQPRILILPDLPILICDRNRYQYDIDGLRQHFQTLIEHIDAYEEHREKYPNIIVCMSKNLKNQILRYEFPWDQSEFEPIATELIDLYSAILPWLNSAIERDSSTTAETVTIRDATQDCYYANPETRHAWQALINSSERCWRGPDNSEYVKVISSVAELRRVYQGDQVVCLVEVIPPPDWIVMLVWAESALPRVGDYPYQPHQSWNGHVPFPRKGSGSNAGPRDDKDQVWTWDLLHGGTHWHIISTNGNRLYEITPDGRIHHRY